MKSPYTITKHIFYPPDGSELTAETCGLLLRQLPGVQHMPLNRVASRFAAFGRTFAYVRADARIETRLPASFLMALKEEGWLEDAHEIGDNIGLVTAADGYGARMLFLAYVLAGYTALSRRPGGHLVIISTLQDLHLSDRLNDAVIMALEGIRSR